MKFDIKKLLVWHSIIFLTFSVQGDLLNQFDLAEAFSWLFDYRNLTLVLTTLVAFFAFSLFSYSILYHFYEKKYTYLVVPMILSGILAAIGFRYFLQEIVQRAIFGFGNYAENYGVKNYILDNLFYALIFTSFGSIFYFIQFSKHKDLLQQKLILQNQKSELALLRSQINPHFLFNTLNNIYTLIYQKSDLSLTAVERLTTLLRYALYEKEEKVFLQKELTAINNLINLQSMRYDYKLALEIEIEPGNESLKIAPLLLIPFVENAFKHGNFKNPKTQGKIHLFSEKEYLVFHSKNEVSLQNKDSVGGIGLKNIKKRLELIYGKKHQLSISENETIFEVVLKIDLSEC